MSIESVMLCNRHIVCQGIACKLSSFNSQSGYHLVKYTEVHVYLPWSITVVLSHANKLNGNIYESQLLPLSSWSRAWQLQYPCWRIPCLEEPGGLQSLELQRVRHDRSDFSMDKPFKIINTHRFQDCNIDVDFKLGMRDKFSFIWLSYTSLGEGNGTPLQYSCLENPMDGGAW